jgi:thermitase
MKPHFIVKVHEPVLAASVPSWLDVIRGQARAAESLQPVLDRLFRRYRLPVWGTMEFPTRHPNTWSRDEIESGLNRIYRFILRENRAIPPTLLDEIRLLPLVQSAHQGAVAQARLPEAQSVASRRSRVAAARQQIGVEEAHAFTRGSPAIKVAVLDTGVAVEHSELRGSTLPGYDFVDILSGADEFIGDSIGYDPDPEDEVGHGTHVAGIIAGAGRSMPIGVAPECKILPVRALAAMRKGDERIGAGLIDNINTAVKWAVDQGADVINMSLGVRHEGGGLPHAEVVDYAQRNGVIVVAASGNDGRHELYYPGALPQVIAVGAADDQGQVAAFSTYGKQVSLIAPGVDIFSCYPGNRYAVATGTSQAAPFVAGAVALMKSYARSFGRSLGDRQAKHVLKNTADRVDKRFKHPKAGFGVLNLADALRWLDHRYHE